jgi:hypothetical protein
VLRNRSATSTIKKEVKHELKNEYCDSELGGDCHTYGSTTKGAKYEYANRFPVFFWHLISVSVYHLVFLKLKFKNEAKMAYCERELFGLDAKYVSTKVQNFKCMSQVNRIYEVS